MSDLPDAYRLDTTAGLHVVKSQFNKTFMEPQCRQLFDQLDQAIAATRKVAPLRDQGYLTRPRTESGEPLGEEARWERGLWRQWSSPDAQPVAGAWERIATYQENLPSSIQANGWGEIDLIGVSSNGLPVIIELKAPNPNQPQSACHATPAGGLVQALSYAVVVQENWASFRGSFGHHLRERMFLTAEMPEKLTSVPIVLAATQIYWDEWIGDTARAATVVSSTWSAFSDLVAAIADRGYPVSFVSLTATGWDERRLPVGINARIVNLPANGVGCPA